MACPWVAGSNPAAATADYTSTSIDQEITFRQAEVVEEFISVYRNVNIVDTL
jgi:hypothetical protein